MNRSLAAPPAVSQATSVRGPAGRRKLADDLTQHIHTENNILFPRFA